MYALDADTGGTMKATNQTLIEIVQQNGGWLAQLGARPDISQWGTTAEEALFLLAGVLGLYRVVKEDDGAEWVRRGMFTDEELKYGPGKFRPEDK